MTEIRLTLGVIVQDQAPHLVQELEADVVPSRRLRCFPRDKLRTKHSFRRLS